MRVEAAGTELEEMLPLSGIAGDKPVKYMPWFFNVCRQRTTDSGMELSVFSVPNTPEDGGWNQPEAFAELYVH